MSFDIHIFWCNHIAVSSCLNLAQHMSNTRTVSKHDTHVHVYKARVLNCLGIITTIYFYFIKNFGLISYSHVKSSMVYRSFPKMYLISVQRVLFIVSKQFLIVWKELYVWTWELLLLSPWVHVSLLRSHLRANCRKFFLFICSTSYLFFCSFVALGLFYCCFFFLK